MSISDKRAFEESAPQRMSRGYADWSDAELLHDDADPAEAFTAFYRRHVDGLIRFVASRRLDVDAAADVVAETFLGAFEARRRYRPEREHARLWLLAIASRRIADQYRRQNSESRRNERLLTEAIVLTQVDRASYDQLLADDDERALDALEGLPLVQQKALHARVLEEREYSDVATALGASQVAARQHVSRGLANLRRKLRGAP